MKMKSTVNIEGILKLLVPAIFCFAVLPAFAQVDKNSQRQAREFMGEAQEALEEEDFATAEAYYRKAIAKDPSNAAAKYNLGSLYHEKEHSEEAVNRLSQATEVSDEKSLKFKSFHNKGNALMKQKKYAEAIEAYKDALRNNPGDDETRYNLALAKEKWEEEQKKGGGKDNKNKDSEDQNKENQDKENKDQQGDKGDQDKNEEGNPKDQEGGDEKNKKEEQKNGEDKKEGEGDKKKEEPKDGEQKEQQQPQPPVPGQLSPQQIKNLLEAMGNEEKKVQDKMNAEKVKGTPTKTEKDW